MAISQYRQQRRQLSSPDYVPHVLRQRQELRDVLPLQDICHLHGRMMMPLDLRNRGSLRVLDDCSARLCRRRWASDNRVAVASIGSKDDAVQDVGVESRALEFDKLGSGFGRRVGKRAIDRWGNISCASRIVNRPRVLRVLPASLSVWVDSRHSR